MAKRRGNNEGTICKRPDGTWRAAISLGHDWTTGKPLRKEYYGKTRKEVADKLTKALAEVRNGGLIEPTKTTLGAWLDKWLAEYKKDKIRPSTYERYEALTKTHIKPALGDMPLAKLQPNTLQAFYKQKLANGRADGQGGLSTRAVRYLHVVFARHCSRLLKRACWSETWLTLQVRQQSGISRCSL